MDIFDLTGKVAIVTGGNGGLGLGIAKGLASEGCAVALVGRNRAKIDAAVADRWGALNVPDPVPTVDGLLAATALVHGLVLVTRNVRAWRPSGRTAIRRRSFGSRTMALSIVIFS